MELLKALAGSKKFWAAIGTSVAVMLISLVPVLEPMQDNIAEIVALGAAYVVGQGLADLGKEKAKIEKK